jgi:tRNA (guanine-N7-)-methyltransferase
MAKNKLKKFGEMQSFPNVFQFPFATLREKGFGMKGLWGREFFGNGNPIILELGCGKGEYAVGLARCNPQKNYIGIDIKGARMWSGAKEAIEKNIPNVAFLRTHIELIDNFFAPDEVSEIWITFPDPQMNKVNRRLTSTRFLSLYRKILKPDGTIHLKTDSPFLYAYTKALTDINHLPSTATDNLYESAITGEITTVKTFYEQQWLERGKTIKYMAFKLPADRNFIEPEEEFKKDDYRSFGRNRQA